MGSCCTHDLRGLDVGNAKDTSKQGYDLVTYTNITACRDFMSSSWSSIATRESSGRLLPIQTEGLLPLRPEGSWRAVLRQAWNDQTLM